MKMKAKRFLALLLATVMMFTLMAPVQADDLTADQTAPTPAVENVTLPVSEKVELTSDAGGDSQWQIRAGDDLWVDISGANKATLQLSYSMVANLLTDGSAAVRCKTTNGDQVSYGSEYQVTVDFDAVPQFAPAPASTAQPAPQDTPETAEEADEETEQTEQTERTEENTAALQQAEEALQAAEEALQAAESAATSESAMTDEQLAALEEARANYDAAKAAYDEAVAASAAGRLAAPAAPQNDGEDEPEVKPTYTITINYVFADGEEAAEPWTGEYPAGTMVDTIVQSPPVTGYEPDQAVIDLGEKFPDGITKDEIITVTYRAALVDYTVKYYEQNIDDDKYTLVKEITQKGYTGDLVGENLAEKKEGFYALLYDTTTPIAADSSTEVEIYYDRYYYLMTFDLDDGGYGVEPIYARYGAPIEVGTPTRPGYTFTGWKLKNGSDELVEPPETMPAENQSYVAQWEEDEQVNLTLVFWGENADNKRYSYLGSAVTTAAPGSRFTYDPTKPGGPDLDNTLICGKEEHFHTSWCVNCRHNHTQSCYSVGVGVLEWLQATSKPTGHELENQGNGIWTYTEDEQTHYYLQLDGEWYCGAGLIAGKDDTKRISLTCGHSHTAECYTCGEEEHLHTESCYLRSLINSNLWTFNKGKSDADVFVEADGSSIVNVYFDRTEFTMHFRRKGSGRDDYGSITDKWGAYIGDQFVEKCEAADSYMWSKPGEDNTYTGYEEIMPQEDRIYYANYGWGTSTATYYIQGLDGHYTEKTKIRVNSNSVTVSDEDRYPFVGFTINNEKSTENGEPFNRATFYYDRNSYQLNFYNYTSPLDTSYTVKYEQPFRDVEGLPEFEPPYPENLEPNAYEFEGWYTAPFFTEYSRVDFEHDTMPANDVLLYANWVPIDRHVKFYLDDTLDYPVGTELTVPHGDKIKAEDVPTEQQLQEENNGQYKKYDFVGWFYKDDDGNETAFDRANVPVKRDLQLYAKWSSNVLMPYTIHYVYVNENDEEITIAEDTTGSALAGTTKTFEAKTGTELNEGYQEGYFPLTRSHSLTIDLDDPEANEYTFVYVQKPDVWYTVQYVDATTKEKLAEDRTVSSSNAVVTENYKYIDGGWMPDAYQKSLVLQAAPENAKDATAWELANNVITFYYSKDDKHAPVHVVHMLQNTVGDDYTLYDDYTDLEQEIDEPYSADILTDIEGAKFAHATANGKPVEVEDGAAQVTATLGKEGLELVLYYDRIEYPYEFQFVDKETGNQIAEPVKNFARYGEQVTQTAKEISGYKLAEGAPNVQEIVIEKEDGETAVNNVAIFYYVKSTAPLTISKKVEGDNYHGEPFLFHITGEGVDMDVLVPGGGSVTIDGLQVGETYTVTEDESWAWRYDVEEPKTVEIEPEGSTIEFTNTTDNGKWFDHTTSAENQWNENGEIERPDQKQ